MNAIFDQVKIYGNKSSPELWIIQTFLIGAWNVPLPNFRQYIFLLFVIVFDDNQ